MAWLSQPVRPGAPDRSRPGQDPASWWTASLSAGSVFLGDWSPGIRRATTPRAPNHVLPTYGLYRHLLKPRPGLDFRKRMTVQGAVARQALPPSPQRLRSWPPPSALSAHKNAAVTLRCRPEGAKARALKI
ncbi:histidinol dehydrogenase [Klebsiella pneumoniae subsp. pneumoniae]|nr:histidinol dehydrogenase [Klebsiella pneumoniae subsp. pneumoniae]